MKFEKIKTNEFIAFVLLTYKSERIPWVQTYYRTLNRHSINPRVYRLPVKQGTGSIRNERTCQKCGTKQLFHRKPDVSQRCFAVAVAVAVAVANTIFQRDRMVQNQNRSTLLQIEDNHVPSSLTFALISSFHPCSRGIILWLPAFAAIFLKFLYRFYELEIVLFRIVMLYYQPTRFEFDFNTTTSLSIRNLYINRLED